ncbi:rCG46675, partial [Rattus norvegicus]
MASININLLNLPDPNEKKHCVTFDVRSKSLTLCLKLVQNIFMGRYFVGRYLSPRHNWIRQNIKMSGFAIITFGNITPRQRPCCSHSTKDDLFVKLFCRGEPWASSK